MIHARHSHGPSVAGVRVWEPTAPGRTAPESVANSPLPLQRSTGNSAMAVTSLLALQQSVGNSAAAAVVSGTLQRLAGPYDPEFIARQLHEAMAGSGTDEEAIFAALSGVSRAELTQVEAEYRRITNCKLRDDLRDELSDGDFSRIAAYQPVGAEVVAEQLSTALAGAGTDEQTIFSALSGRSPADVNRIATAYLRLTGHTLISDLQDDLSPSELNRLGASAPKPAVAARAQADAVAAQLRGAMTGAGTNEEAISAALTNRSPGEISDISLAYRRLTGVDLSVALRDELSGSELASAITQLGLVPTVSRTNTELGMLSVGNFDFLFASGRITVTVRVKFQFTGEITGAERAAFKQRFINAVEATWRHSGYSLTGAGPGAVPTVPIEIMCAEDESNYHKVVDVEKRADSDRRPMIASDINVNLGTDETTLAHEFGHVVGLYDEYDGGFFENIMFWHENRPEDPSALMSGGAGLRPRYFEHYRRTVQAAAPPGCVYTVSSPP